MYIHVRIKANLTLGSQLTCHPRLDRHAHPHIHLQNKRKRLPHGRTDAFGEKKARHLELQERFLARPELQHDAEEVDPMLPGGKVGRWSDGLNIDGERAADTTASGETVF